MRRIVVAMMLAACAKTVTPKQSTGWGGITDPARLLRGVPADAALVVIGELPRPVTGVSMFVDEKTAQAMAAEVEAYLTTRTGLSMKEARGGAGFLRGKDVGFVVHHVSGELRGADADGLLAFSDGLAVARRDDLLVGGNVAAVRAALEVLDGKQPGLVAGSPFFDLFVAEAKGAVVAAGVGPAAWSVPQLAALTAMGLDAGVLTVRRTGIRAVLIGPDEKLQGVAEWMRRGLDLIARTAEAEKRARQTSGDVLEGVVAIQAAHYTAYLRRAAEPKIEKGHMVVDVGLDFGDTMIVVPVVGILAAVAIPAFMKNARKAKTAEAITMTKRIYDSARELAARGRPPAVLQGTVGPTPALGACCLQGGKCRPDPTLWVHPLWRQLDFTVDDPNYYSYSYAGDGKTFTVTANGDLNCDGVYSTFEITGTLNDDGTVTAPGAMVRDKELE